MLRGINRQRIFEDEEDCQKFIAVLKNYKAICEYQVYAYCLMGNHVHLLLRAGKEELSKVFKRIGSSYVYWYNWKYRRSGHLFQDRYKSEPVSDDEYLLAVIRYIHRNPLKAGICKELGDYAHSSYNAYAGASEDGLTDTGYVLGIVRREEFIEYHKAENEDCCLEMEESFRLTDKEAQAIIKKVTRCKNQAEFQALRVQDRSKYIAKLKDKGLSIRQICRLTGVSFGVARKDYSR